MNRAKKERLNKELIEEWYYQISKRGYFDYWLIDDYWEIETKVFRAHRDASWTYIHNAFWKHVYFDKDFLYQYEY